jgi:hypothetical protein
LWQASLSGTLLFLGSWLVISLWLWGPESTITLFASPWQSLQDSALRPEGPAARVLRLGVDGVRLLLWVSPWVLLLAGWQLRRLTRAATHLPGVVIGWAGVIYGVIYWLLRGTSWSFPRYHVAVMPVLALLAGTMLQQVLGQVIRARRGFVAATGLLTLAGLLLLDDPLLFPTVGWKQAVLFGSLPSAGGRWLIHAGLFLVAPLLAGSLARRRGAAVACASLISLGALDLTQAQAAYRVSYQYGAQGKTEVVQLIAAHLQPGEAVLATPEFLHEWRQMQVPRFSLGFWQHSQVADWHAVLREQQPRAVVFGLTTQTLAQWQAWLRDDLLQQELEAHYEAHIMGTYRVWLRRPAGVRYA